MFAEPKIYIDDDLGKLEFHTGLLPFLENFVSNKNILVPQKIKKSGKFWLPNGWCIKYVSNFTNGFSKICILYLSKELFFISFHIFLILFTSIFAIDDICLYKSSCVKF